MFRIGEKVVYKNNPIKIFTITEVVNTHPLYVKIDENDNYLYNGYVFESLNNIRKRKIKRICSKKDIK